MSKHDIIADGTIDENYRGSLGVKLFNLSQNDYAVHVGDRIAQLVIEPVIKPNIDRVDELDETDRANGGFGSTGK